MRAWLALLPALGVLLSGCGRQGPLEPAARAAPGPQSRPASIVSVAPSPTGTALVIGVMSTDPPPGLDRFSQSLALGALWLIDLRTGAISNLSPEPKRPAGPRSLGWNSLSWRADGGAVAVGTPEGRIMIQDVAGGGGHVVSPEGLLCLTPAWSPDGKHLAFAVSNTPPGPRMPSGPRSEAALYVMPADGSAPPRLQVAGLAPSTRWWWSADGRRLRYVADEKGAVKRADAQSIAEAVSSEGVRHAHAAAWSPDRTRLAYSSEGDRGRGSVTTVVDASLTPLMRWRDPDVPAQGLLWSPDSKQLLTRNASGQTYLLDLATKAGSPVDDPVAARKEPAGWIAWNHKWQLLFIDEEWKRLVVMESLEGPAYTLITLGEDGSPSLVLPATKGN